MRRRIPNALTIARLVLAGVFFIILARTGHAAGATLLWAAGLYAVAASTDALDGYLARRWNVISRFGRIVDPFADKVLVLGGFIVLSGPAFHDGHLQVSGVTPLMSVVIVARELLVTSLRGLVEAEGADFSAIAAGKWKMIVQSLALPGILVVIAMAGDPTSGIARTTIGVLAWATVLITAASAVPYVLRAAQRRSDTKPGTD